MRKDYEDRILTEQEWDAQLQLRYNTMPRWWYNTITKREQYNEYVKSAEKWIEKKSDVEITT